MRAFIGLVGSTVLQARRRIAEAHGGLCVVGQLDVSDRVDDLAALAPLDIWGNFTEKSHRFVVPVMVASRDCVLDGELVEEIFVCGISTRVHVAGEVTSTTRRGSRRCTPQEVG